MAHFHSSKKHMDLSEKTSLIYLFLFFSVSKLKTTIFKILDDFNFLSCSLILFSHRLKNNASYAREIQILFLFYANNIFII